MSIYKELATVPIIMLLKNYVVDSVVNVQRLRYSVHAGKDSKPLIDYTMHARQYTYTLFLVAVLDSGALLLFLFPLTEI